MDNVTLPIIYPFLCVCVCEMPALSQREKSRDMCGREGSGAAGSQLRSHSVCVCMCMSVCSNQRTQLGFTYLLSFAGILTSVPGKT